MSKSISAPRTPTGSVGMVHDTKRKVDGGQIKVAGLQDELRLRHPVLMQCCTCDLCGCGPVFEFIFAAAGTAWCAYDMQSHDFINRIACFSKCQCGGKGTKVSVKG